MTGTGSVRGVFDDNIDRVPENRRDDYFLAASAGLSVESRGLRLTGSGRYQLTAEFFRRDEDEPIPLTHAGSLAVAYAATRDLSLRVADSVRYSRRRETDAEAALLPVVPSGEVGVPEPPPPATPGSVPTRRVEQFNNTAVAGATYAAGPFTTLALEYSLASERFDEPDLTDSDTHRATFTAGRQVSRVDNVGVVYGFSVFAFDEPGDEPERRTRYAHDGRLRWGRRLGAATDLSASVGGSFTDHEEEGDLEWAGMTGALSIDRQEPNARFRVGYSRDLSTGGGRSSVQETDRAFVSVSRTLSRRWTGRFAVAAARNRNVDTGGGRTDTASASLDLGVRVTDWLRGEVTYDVEYVDESASPDAYYVNRISVGLTALFPVYRPTRF